jgi:GTP-binding protein HflX
VVVEDRLFATLDPSSRRLRFPREREAIITDTVGFIRDLPEDLMDAFAATLEELHDADLLLHVVDASSPRMEEQMETVERVLRDLELDRIPTLLVLNKADLLEPGEAAAMAENMRGVAISAIAPRTFSDLLPRIEQAIWLRSSSPGTSTASRSAQ